MDRRASGGGGLRAAVPLRTPATRTRTAQRRILAAAVGYTVAVTVLATWRGPGASPDSVAYASAARRLADTGTLTMFDGGYLRFFPPGLPATLAGLQLLGIPLGVAVTLLNCVAAGGTVVVTERIAARGTGSPVLAGACAVTLAVSMGFVSVNAMLWTEPVVGLTTAAWILLLQRVYADDGLTRSGVAALTLLATVSYSYRYAAIFMIPTTAVVVAIAYWHRGRQRAVGVAGLVAAATGAGLVALAAHNIAHGAGPLGDRAPSERDGDDVAWQAVDALGALLVNTDAAPSLLLRAAGLTVVAAAVTLAVRRIRPGGRRAGSAPRRAGPLLPVAVATAAYWAFLVAGELTTAINPIGYRLLYPILPAMVVLGVVGGRTLLAGSRRPLIRRLWRTRHALFAAYLTGLACAGFGWSFDAADRGLGYSAVGRTDAAWVPVVRQLPVGAAVISDHPYLVHWLTGREPVHPAFGLAFYASADPADRGRALCSTVHNHTETYLLWVGDHAAEGVREFANQGFSTSHVSTGDGHSLYAVDGCYRASG